MTILTKHYLDKNGISKSVIPEERPSFNEWAKEIHSRDSERVNILNDSLADEVDTLFHKQTNHNQK